MFRARSSRLFLAGASIASMMFWVPQSGDIGIGVSILSYDGAVQFGVISDRHLCPDPDLLIERFAPELEKLVLATLLAPWPWNDTTGRTDDGERAFRWRVARRRTDVRRNAGDLDRAALRPCRVGVRHGESFLEQRVQRHRQLAGGEPFVVQAPDLAAGK